MIAVLLLLATPAAAHAYVGPGAGIAFVSSFLVLFVTILVSFFSLLLYPFKAAIRAIRGLKRPKAKVKRFIVVGLDGQDPRLTDRFLQEGKLPNFQKLADQGGYHRLASTFPSVSPVAWSSFSTGSHPARHNIFDFLDRDRRTYLPELSSTKIGSVEKTLNVGKYRIPLEKPELRLLRKSKPFWSVLGEYDVWSTILRVPITFPPDEFRGAQLSAMCVPDLLGTQGTFLLFTTRRGGEAFKEGGMRVHLPQLPGAASGAAPTSVGAAAADPVDVGTQEVASSDEPAGTRAAGAPRAPAGSEVKGMKKDDTAAPARGTVTQKGSTVRIETTLEGPENEMREGKPPMELPVAIELDRAAGVARVEIGGECHTLGQGELSEWVDLTFRAAPGVKLRGITRMMVTEMDEHFSLYMTPIALDPEKPAMPISHPSYYSTYLAKKIGKYSTLGLAEDTWALNEGVVDDGTFLELTYDIDREREEMFFAALDRLRKGALVCVFDATDRIQHMFWRYLEDGHPAARGIEDPEHADAIEELYVHNDRLVGRVMEQLDDDDLLMVISDHGFDSFRRGINLNAWLHDNGYLHLKEGTDGRSEWLRDVDWSRTKAYCIGLTGMFLNVSGRESEGIVEPEAVPALKAELIDELSGLEDTDTGTVGIREVFDTAALYSGPYLGDAPDLLIGYNAGYRSSWDCATGVVATPVFEDNTKAWSGDHCIDPRLVPGVLFCNREIAVDDPALIDIAPTVLQQFGIEPPAYMDGKVLFADDEEPEGAEGDDRSQSAEVPDGEAEERDA